MPLTARKPSPTASILTAVLAIVAWAPAQAWAWGAGTSGQSSDDVPDKPSRLMVIGDFNRDGIVDTAEATLPAEDHAGAGLLTISLGQPDGSYKQITSKPLLGPTPRSIVVGDFNKDGIPDLIVGDDDGALMLFLGDGTGNMVAAGNIAHLDSVVSIAVADFNHDGIPDLGVTDWRASTVTVFIGTGKASFQRGWSSPLRMPGTTPHISIADFNGDGIPDLAVVYNNDDGDTFDVMLGNGTGSFTYAPSLSLFRDPNSHCAT